jgi:hypothetical protein
MRSRSAISLLEARVDAGPLARVARALSGRCDLLRAEDFREGVPEIQEDAAYGALRRCQARPGLDIAVQNAEGAYAARRLRDILLAADAPGRAELERVEDMKALRAWYIRYGYEYLVAPATPR